MLDHVRDRLRHGEVGGRLNRCGQPGRRQVQVEFDGHRDRQDQGADGPLEPTVGQHWRLDASDQVAKVTESCNRGAPSIGQQFPRATGSASNRSSAIPRLMPRDTRRAWAPSCRSRSSLCSSASCTSRTPRRERDNVPTRSASTFSREARQGQPDQGVQRKGQAEPEQRPERPKVPQTAEQPYDHALRPQQDGYGRVPPQGPLPGRSEPPVPAENTPGPNRCRGSQPDPCRPEVTGAGHGPDE